MNRIETIRTFKTKNFTIRVDAVEDFDLDLSFDDDGSIRKQLENGSLVAFGVVVTCYLKGGKVANDSLWGCIYETPRAFMDHIGLGAKRTADGRNYGSYFTDMIHQVCADARKHVGELQTVKVRQ